MNYINKPIIYFTLQDTYALHP